MIIVWSPIRRLLGCEGIVLFPFIVLAKKEHALNKRIMNHERIHIRQALEMFVVPFYVWYVLEFLVRRCYVDSKYEAYRSISFEQEAYDNDFDMDYLHKRKPYRFASYFLKWAQIN